MSIMSTHAIRHVGISTIFKKQLRNFCVPRSASFHQGSEIDLHVHVYESCIIINYDGSVRKHLRVRLVLNKDLLLVA